MNQQQLQKLSDNNVRQLLLDNGKIELLEEILAAENSEFQSVTEAISPQDFGQKQSREEIQSLFTSVVAVVNKFLEVDKVAPPTLRTFSIFEESNRDIVKSYSIGTGLFGLGIGTALVIPRLQRKTKTHQKLTRRSFLLGAVPACAGMFFLLKGAAHHRIRLNDAAYNRNSGEISYPAGAGKVDLEMFLAHEYTHHLQSKFGFYTTRQYSLWMAMEGHARGIDQHVSKTFAKERNNLAYRRHYLKRSVPELQSVYLWMCQNLGTQPKSNLLGDSQLQQNADIQLSSHGPGHALLRILALKHSERIYRDLIHGDFALPEIG